MDATPIYPTPNSSHGARGEEGEEARGRCVRRTSINTYEKSTNSVRVIPSVQGFERKSSSMSERSGGSERWRESKGEKDGKLSLLRGGKEVKVYAEACVY